MSWCPFALLERWVRVLKRARPLKVIRPGACALLKRASSLGVGQPGVRALLERARSLRVKRPGVRALQWNLALGS